MPLLFPGRLIAPHTPPHPPPPQKKRVYFFSRHHQSSERSSQGKVLLQVERVMFKRFSFSIKAHQPCLKFVRHGHHSPYLCRLHNTAAWMQLTTANETVARSSKLPKKIVQPTNKSLVYKQIFQFRAQTDKH